MDRQIMFDYRVTVQHAGEKIGKERPDFCTALFGAYGSDWDIDFHNNGSMTYKFTTEADAVLFSLRWT